jgi:DNA-binding MarR family transcriptional regulator
VGEPEDQQLESPVEALMATSKILTAVVSRSLAAAGAAVSTPQLRVLVMLGSEGPLNLTAVAHGLGVNASNASRTCDQLVTARLLTRREDSEDRRNIVLHLTKSGTALLEKLMDHRRVVFTRIVERMSTRDRAALERGLGSFQRAAQALSAEGSTQDDDHLLRWLI